MPASFPWPKKGAKKTDGDDLGRAPSQLPPGYAADQQADAFYRQQAHDSGPESYYPATAASIISSDAAAAAAADYYTPGSRYASTVGTPDSKSLRDKASIGSASDAGFDLPAARATKLFGRRQSVRRDKAPGDAAHDPRLPQVQETTYTSPQARPQLHQSGNRASQFIPTSPADPGADADPIEQYFERRLPQLSDQRFDVQRRNRKAQIESSDQPIADGLAADQPHHPAPQRHDHHHDVDHPPPPDPVQRKFSVLRKHVADPLLARGLSTRQPHRRNQSSESIDPKQLLVGGAAAPGTREPAAAGPPHPAMSRANTQAGNPADADAPIAMTRQPQDMTPDEVAQLVKEYRDLRDKYSKVKRYYFEKDDQVKSLQNTLAHQRLTASRTAWDDGEYMQRFTRLDGLISQLAFSFRKDWHSLPVWIQPYVNKDAIQTGKQEMTAVGRAIISRWLSNEVFDRYFSPALDSKLSTELKLVQHNIRSFHPQFQTAEEEEALNSKIINWRLATIDGLQHLFNTNEAQSNRKALSDALEHSLVEELQSHMNDGLAGLEGGVHMIIELAVAILANLPFESRDVHIEYILPGTVLDTDKMKIETGIPPLTEPLAPGGLLAGHDDDFKAPNSAVDAAPPQQQPVSDDTDAGDKKGFLGGLMSKAKAGTNPGSANQSTTSLGPPASAAKDEQTPRVRLCSFLSLEIRGKMNLVKAPVYRA